MDIKNSKWSSRMLILAKEVASWSKDKSTKVGAVITTEDGRPLSWGFNGPPMNIDDTINERHERPEKYKWMCHAEQNAIDLAPGSVKNGVMFVTYSPCSNCARSIIQNQIQSVVIDSDYSADKMPDHWKSDMTTAIEMLSEAGVEVLIINIQE